MLALATFAALATTALPKRITLQVDGVERWAFVFAPSRKPTGGASRAVPVVIGYHGHTGTAGNAAMSFGLQRAWPEALVIYPQGLATASYYDPAGTSTGWDVLPTPSNRDVKFTDELLKLAVNDYGGDPRHIFAMGHSNGGLFMYTLWATRPDKFVAFGTFASTGGQRVKVPKPAFLCVGDKDPLVNIALQTQSMDAVLKLDQCPPGGTALNSNLTEYKGIEPVEVWRHENGHKFQKDAVPSLVSFFKSFL